MRVITEDYVSFETALMLKEKGFREVCNRYYNAQFKEVRTVSDTFAMDWNDEEHMRRIYMPGAVSIPTLQMAMKWLREEHNLFISIQPDFPSEDGYKMCWFWSADMLYQDSVNSKGCQFYVATYERACESAIRYCLEKLI